MYFRAWQNDTSLGELTDLLTRSTEPDPLAIHKPLFLLLDQLEEYVLYRQAEGLANQFDAALARLIKHR